jgi:hypothetical protein
MKFESTSEALRWYVKICSVGVCSGSAAIIEKDDDQVLPNEIDSGPPDPMLWANLIHMKVDIENAFLRCFPDKRGAWVQKIMKHWAVDGYDETIDMWFSKISRFHGGKGRTARTELLGSWIWEFTEELISIGYLKRKVAYQNIDTSFLLANNK